MTADSPHRERSSRKRKIEELKRKATELAGGDMIFGESDECPPEVAEEFWERVVAYEEAPWSTLFKQLEESGVHLPTPESPDDRELHGKLWELIWCPAFMNVFLSQTGHLSDRELYTLLWTDVLREETKVLPFDEGTVCHLELPGSGSEEDTNLYLKYYADEDARRDWKKDFPDTPLPEHENPPYDRDRYLP